MQPEEVSDKVKVLMAKGKSMKAAIDQIESVSKNGIVETLIKLENMKIVIDSIIEYLHELDPQASMNKDDSLPEDIKAIIGDEED